MPARTRKRTCKRTTHTHTNKENTYDNEKALSQVSYVFLVERADEHENKQEHEHESENERKGSPVGSRMRASTTNEGAHFVLLSRFSRNMRGKTKKA